MQRYYDKRDFSVTPEPRGSVGEAIGGNGRFVVQKHAARRLHYDFRLELDGTLKSWAVPKGPSLDPGEKRLAVHVEDHPLEYGSFEGEIPAKQYGAGKVVLWDDGTWQAKGDAAADYRAGRLKFELRGHKLHGGWNLVRMRKPAADGKENWLLIKERDDEARSDGEAEITVLAPRSVASGRLLEEIGGPDASTWQSNRGDGAKDDNPRDAQKDDAGDGKDADQKPGHGKKSDHDKKSAARTHTPPREQRDLGVESALPKMIEPQLATLVSHAPTDAGWVYEIKYDGYRMLTRLAHGKARVFTRNGHDWTDRVPALAQAMQTLPVSEAWLDGEIAVLDAEGKSSFHALQKELSEDAKGAPICYYLFDLLYLDGRDVRALPLIQRKALLAKLLSDAPASALVRFSEHIDAPGKAFHEQACLHGLEGAIGKRSEARYIAGRSRTWIKLKCRNRQEFVIAGYTDPAGARKGIGALLLGVHDAQGELRFAGKVGTGFDETLLRDLGERLGAMAQNRSPFDDPPSRQAVRGAHWVRPELVAEVSFTGWTGDNIARQASFEGLREDKPAEGVVHESAESPARSADARGDETEAAPTPKANPRAARNAVSAPEVAGVVLSNPDRVMYPSEGFTKLDIARYYEAVAEWIVPHLQGRPLSLVRCPAGSRGHCFFQKHMHETMPDELTPIELEESDGTGTYVIANDISGVVRLVQLGVLELHTWGSSQSDPALPDRIIFDLDPDPALPWNRVIEAAHLVQSLLQELGLESFPKTTGGKGLHLVLPLQRRHSWDEVKGFSRAVAEHLARVLPAQFTAVMTKTKREDKVYVDYLRNGRGATAIAAFSTRARPGATVSVPLDWSEVEEGTRSDHFNIANVPARLAKLRADPWARYWTLKQSITAEMKRKLGITDAGA
ncbi:MAG: DNA ligase D [Betaproteobacteria bacterium]